MSKYKDPIFATIRCYARVVTNFGIISIPPERVRKSRVSYRSNSEKVYQVHKRLSQYRSHQAHTL